MITISSGRSAASRAAWSNGGGSPHHAGSTRHSIMLMDFEGLLLFALLAIALIRLGVLLE
jgi:hypothetical protein